MRNLGNLILFNSLNVQADLFNWTVVNEHLFGGPTTISSIGSAPKC